MNTLNIEATNVFLKLVNLLGEKQSLKIDNTGEVYMPVHFEKLYKTDFGGNVAFVFSLAHYYKQNGDLVPDPDMTFIFLPEKELVYPASFQNSMVYKESIFQEEGTWKMIKSEQKYSADFANMWLKNIKEQQGI